MDTLLSRDFYFCLVQPFVVPDVTGSPDKKPILYILQSFLKFASPSLSPWIYALPSCLPLLDVCLLLITLFKLSCTYFHSFLPPTMLH